MIKEKTEKETSQGMERYTVRNKKKKSSEGKGFL